MPERGPVTLVGEHSPGNDARPRGELLVVGARRPCSSRVPRSCYRPTPSRAKSPVCGNSPASLPPGANANTVFVSADATVLHADLDFFDASVEQRDAPLLRGRPVIVGGGVVLAASYEAKRHGVQGGMGGSEARRRCRRQSSCRPAWRPIPRRARLSSRSSSRPRPWSSRFRSTRPSSTRADGGRVRHSGSDRSQAPPRGATSGGAADHGRRRADQVPREGRKRGCEARRPAGRAARRRARSPPPPSHRVPVGSRPRHPRKLGVAGSRPFEMSPARTSMRSSSCSAARGPPHPRARTQPGPAARPGSTATLDGVATRARTARTQVT